MAKQGLPHQLPSHSKYNDIMPEWLKEIYFFLGFHQPTAKDDFKNINKTAFIMLGMWFFELFLNVLVF